jgi:hypothetical protein
MVTPLVVTYQQITDTTWIEVVGRIGLPQVHLGEVVDWDGIDGDEYGPAYIEGLLETCRDERLVAQQCGHTSGRH